MFISVENIDTLESQKFISVDEFNREFKVYPEVGDVLMTRIGDVGTTNVVRSTRPIAYYVSLALLKKKNMPATFLSFGIQSPNIQKEIWRRTLHVAFPKKINKIEIEKIPFFKTRTEEEIKIGVFFENLNYIVNLQQRKLELLKKIKQGYLQQLFPSKGQSIPNIRFSEFKENWIQKKLGNYLSIPEKKQVDNLKDLKLMTLKLNLGGINLSANRETLELGATKYFVRKSGQLIYGKQNFFHGSIAIIPDNADGYATSGDVPALDIEGIQPKFLLDYISRPSYYLEKEARAIGTGSKRIHEKDLFSFEISSPSQIEQIKITNIVDNMDKILILQKSKIQKLKQLKQAYLQKLFP
ncbi:hypothetical protein [Latilactobacillus curvatus]